jgi:hypothetical protein
VEVPAVEFSAALQKSAATAVKLNIEGAEIAILQQDIRWSDVRKLVFEWSFDVEPRMKILRDVRDRLERTFARVEFSRKNLPWNEALYRYYPPNVYGFAWRDV